MIIQDNHQFKKKNNNFKNQVSKYHNKINNIKYKSINF